MTALIKVWISTSTNTPILLQRLTYCCHLTLYMGVPCMFWGNFNMHLDNLSLTDFMSLITCFEPSWTPTHPIHRAWSHSCLEFQPSASLRPFFFDHFNVRLTEQLSHPWSTSIPFSIQTTSPRCPPLCLLPVLVSTVLLLFHQHHCCRNDQQYHRYMQTFLHLQNLAEHPLPLTSTILFDATCCILHMSIVLQSSLYRQDKQNYFHTLFPEDGMTCKSRTKALEDTALAKSPALLQHYFSLFSPHFSCFYPFSLPLYRSASLNCRLGL